ncbi:MAG: hypothetical protein ACO1QB_09320 [Verrucomicrobiales bacterium]
MKIAKMSFAWFMVSMALAALLIVKWNTEKQQQAKIEKLQLQVEESAKAVRLANTKADEQQQESAKIQSQLRAAEMEAYQAKQQAALSNQAAATALRNQQTKSPGSVATAPARGSNPMAQMLKDPEMRKMIQAQQTAMMNMMYSPLFKKLELSTEESDQLKAILSEAQSKATEHAGSLLEENGEEKQAALKEMTGQQQEAQKQIKELLGEDRYTKFQEYSQTLGERMLMSQFQQQHNLQPEKVDQILDMIRQEKQSAQMPDMNSPDGSRAFMEMVNQPDAIQKLIEQQNLVNDRVIQRAATVLSPEELKDFTEFQQNQAKMQRFGLETAAKMFGANKDGQAPPNIPAPQPVQQAPQQ